MSRNVQYPALCLRAARATLRAEKDSFSELAVLFGKPALSEASKRAGTRDSFVVFGRLWKWACKRWPDFPDAEYSVRTEKQ